MPPRTRRQATQPTQSSENTAPVRAKRTTRSTSSTAPRPKPANPSKTRAPRSKRNTVHEDEESPKDVPSSPAQLIEPRAISSPNTPNDQPDTSEDRVEDLLANVGANDSLVSVQQSGDSLNLVRSSGPTTSSPKNVLSEGLPPSSPPSRVPSSSTDSGSAEGQQAIAPPSKRLGFGRPVRRPGMLRSRAPATSNVRPNQEDQDRDASLSPSSDPFGFFALQKRLRVFHSAAKHRLDEQIEHEAEVMADQPSVQFSDGVPFASPTTERRRRQEEESMAEVDKVLEEVTNVLDAEPVVIEHDQEDSQPVRKRTLRSKAPARGNTVYDEIPRLPKRRPRNAARAKKEDQENISEEDEGQKAKRSRGKISKIDKGKGKAILGKRAKTEIIDLEEDQDLLRARDQRMKMFKDVDDYNLEEELVI